MNSAPNWYDDDDPRHGSGERLVHQEPISEAETIRRQNALIANFKGKTTQTPRPTAHTPTLIALLQTPLYHSGEHHITICDPKGEIRFAVAKGRTLEEAKANAALIVRAVNCHAELVVALKQAEEWMTHSLVKLGQGNAGMVAATKQARAILARAEGGKP